MIPEVLSHPYAVTSLGCIGNRVYTGLPDDELYLAVPGAKLADITQRLQTVVGANDTLRQFHEARAAS
jgi:uncharacterized protein (DUF169 family)